MNNEELGKSVARNLIKVMNQAYEIKFDDWEDSLTDMVRQILDRHDEAQSKHEYDETIHFCANCKKGKLEHFGYWFIVQGKKWPMNFSYRTWVCNDCILDDPKELVDAVKIE